MIISDGYIFQIYNGYQTEASQARRDHNIQIGGLCIGFNCEYLGRLTSLGEVDAIDFDGFPNYIEDVANNVCPRGMTHTSM